MDPLSSLLSGIRAEGSVVSHAVLTAPWSITFADAAPLTMVTVLRGGGTLLLAEGTERAIGAGDTAIIQGPARFRLADRARHCPPPSCRVRDQLLHRGPRVQR